MAILRPGTSRWQGISLITGVALLFLGFAALIYGEFAQSIEFAGLVNYAIIGIGFLMFGLSFVLILIALAGDTWRKRGQSDRAPAEIARTIVRELGVVALNILCYAGTAFLALGSLSVLDQNPFVCIVILVLCVVAFIFYRKHRKRHKIPYTFTSSLGLLALMLALALGGLLIGTRLTADAAIDAARGPRTTFCLLSDAKVDRPTGRYSAFQATSVNLELTDEEGELIRVSIKKQDRDAILTLLETNGRGYLTYYPRTQVFVGFQPPPGQTNSTSGASS